MGLSKNSVKVVLSALLTLFVLVRVPGLYRKIRRVGIWPFLKLKLTRLAMRLPKHQKGLAQLDTEAKRMFKGELLKHRENPTHDLPEDGMPAHEILSQVQQWADRDQQFQNGKLSGAVYYGSKELNEFVASVMNHYVISNTLHPDVFPSVRQMESEIIQITLNLFHAPAEGCGVLTSGGTESILLAMLAYREWGRIRGIREPEIIAGVTVHAAFEKAAHYFGMTLVHVPVDANQQMDLHAVRREINGNTVVIVGSAPCYSSGIIDPLEELGQLALRYKKNFHIDACLGGFLIPFSEDAGHQRLLCDFRVKGVTSISCDPHKYGYTPKGVSVIMYSDPEIRRLQYFTSPQWCGGAYMTAYLGGSRPGVNSAGAWATLLYFGRRGYTECAKAILDAAVKIKQAIQEIPELDLLGRPVMSVVAFTSSQLNVHAVAGEMHNSYGWSLHALLNPNAVHMCMTYSNCHLADEFIENLKASIAVIKNSEDISKYTMAALYGVTTQLPDQVITKNLLTYYVDYLYQA